MKLNAFIIRISLMILIIFGGTFVIQFVKSGDLLVGQMIGFGIGTGVLLAAVMWRKKNGGVQEG
ncbi:hypothetical protein [Bacillus sp. KH172YL63]|uniref:hypothetical protein n=1 Tax=Bacillus sp. KH172YL63 TaxID=2709784 RepID=UPI0013E43243|nr:hypothetical protein [Bacillus sp. KH172YL63]BCB04193.1 hypothetical protein KH172YL63_23260 [Bacillus sp. KH172YL63]